MQADMRTCCHVCLVHGLVMDINHVLMLPIVFSILNLLLLLSQITYHLATPDMGPWNAASCLPLPSCPHHLHSKRPKTGVVIARSLPSTIWVLSCKPDTVKGKLHLMPRQYNAALTMHVGPRCTMPWTFNIQNSACLHCVS